MRKIINPWKNKRLFHCFGCDDTNPIGLKMEFYDDGEQLICDWVPNKNYEGYIDTLHGGIQSTLHDEMGSWIVYTKGETAGMTTELNVRFLKSVNIDGTSIKLVGKITEQNRRFITMHTQLLNSENEVCSEADVVYRVFPQSVAIAKLHYPGTAAFYEE